MTLDGPSIVKLGITWCRSKLFRVIGNSYMRLCLAREYSVLCYLFHGNWKNNLNWQVIALIFLDIDIFRYVLSIRQWRSFNRSFRAGDRCTGAAIDTKEKIGYKTTSLCYLMNIPLSLIIREYCTVESVICSQEVKFMKDI